MPLGGIIRRLKVVTHLSEDLKQGKWLWGLMSDVTMGWKHSQPMPMRGSPCIVSESNALAYIKKLPSTPRVFLFSDSDRAVPGDWGFVGSVRPGVPPEGIMAELDAWLRQYPDAWLAVDMRDGVIPPSVSGKITDVLRTFPRIVLVIVSDDTKGHSWPKWELPL